MFGIVLNLIIHMFHMFNVKSFKKSLSLGQSYHKNLISNLEGGNLKHRSHHHHVSIHEPHHHLKHKLNKSIKGRGIIRL